VKRRTFKIVFQPSGRRGEVEEDKTLLDASRELGVDIESICGGKQTCGKCMVKIEEGRFDRVGIRSSLSHASEWQASEAKFIDPQGKAKGFRLACAAKIRGEILAFVPEESRAGQQVIHKAAGEIKITHDPAVKLYDVELDQPSLDHPLADLERLTEKLHETHGLTDLMTDYFVLMDLPRILREAGWKVTVAVWNEREIIRVYPGHVQEYWGVAVDIGTTTVAAYLCSLKTGTVHATESIMNPQVVYGEDIMSRITYAMMHPDKGLEEMSRLIVQGLNDMIGRAATTCRIETEDILDMTVVGNTAMHHLLLKIDPRYVGAAPFAPAVHRSLDIKARELGIGINRSSYVHILPIEAGFVGADNVGVLIREEPYHKKETQLIIDIGTNGELILGNRERLISSSCATGPALEGAQITYGMRAAPGAIERIRIDSETFDVNYKVIGREAWKGEIQYRET